MISKLWVDLFSKEVFEEICNIIIIIIQAFKGKKRSKKPQIIFCAGFDVYVRSVSFNYANKSNPWEFSLVSSLQSFNNQDMALELQFLWNEYNTIAQSETISVVISAMQE